VNHYYSYLNTSEEILLEYKGEEPLAYFLKFFFSHHKKYGSRDRKQIAHLCYCYFRLGKSLLQVPVEERILIGLFLCSTEPNEILQQLKPEWNKQVDLPADKKLLIIPARLRQSGGNYSLLIEDVFPWKEKLSETIDQEKFGESFFVQPDLFLRLRPGNENSVKEKLLQAGINFKEFSPACLALPNTSKIENIIELDKEAVVQDYNSQQIGEYLKLAISPPSHREQLTINAWDCCAASGGKSLLLYDLTPHVDLTVSDIRESILINLKKRFAKAGIKNYRSFIADLTNDSRLPTPDYDLIICDAPCTGSGTWGRTPEQLYFFDDKKIEEYSSLQKKIVSDIIPYLKKNGFLIYITCSVFKKENEEIAEFIKTEFHLQLVKMEWLMGYDRRADTMFVALFKKS
jgi:16S rRNA (cytosine967-C5)-methyltransferase